MFLKLARTPKVEFVPVFHGSLPAAEHISPSIKKQQYHRETLNQSKVSQDGFKLP